MVDLTVQFRITGSLDRYVVFLVFGLHLAKGIVVPIIFSGVMGSG